MEKAAQDEAARKKKRGLKMAANVRRTSSIVAEQHASRWLPWQGRSLSLPMGTVAPEPRIVSNAQSPFNAMGPPPPRAPGVAGVPRALPKAGAWKAGNAPITRAEAEAAGEATWKSSERRRRQSYDEAGNQYLDTRNNVGHVGHSNARVARAVSEQVYSLNTNTRYLHQNVSLLAEKLAATLPAPLEVCFFVNSGSEANDLAIRLARAHTGNQDFVVVDRVRNSALLNTNTRPSVLATPLDDASRAALCLSSPARCSRRPTTATRRR